MDMPLGDGSTQRMQWNSKTQSYIPIQVSGLDSANQAVKGDDLIGLVKGFEGFNPRAYNDYKQISIGYGTKGKEGEVLNEEQATERLKSELSGHAERITKAAELKGIALNQNQFNALTSFDYNTGRGANLIERFGDNPQQLASKILEYTKAGGEDLPGLVKRRQIEAALFLAPEEQAVGASQVTPQNQPRIGVTPAKPQQTSRIVSGKEAMKLGATDPQKEYIVVEEGGTTTRISPTSTDTIGKNVKAYEAAGSLYEAGDRLGALNILRALKAKDIYGDITDQTLDEYMKTYSSTTPTSISEDVEQSSSVDFFDSLTTDQKKKYLDTLSPEARKNLLDQRLNKK
jgi:lysozyme